MTSAAIVELARRAAYARGMDPPAPDGAEAFLRDVVVGRKGQPAAPDVDSIFDVVLCRVCGCSDVDACEGGCWWVADPAHMGDLCSTCQPFVLERVGVQR